MVIFFFKEDKGKYFLIHRRKYTIAFAFLPLIFIFALSFFMAYVYYDSETTKMLIRVVFLLFIIVGTWMGLEGIYYGYFLPKKFEKEGKKIERSMGEGIKISK